MSSVAERKQLEAVRRVSEVLFQNVTLPQIVEIALKVACEETDAEAGSVLLADSATQTLVFEYSIGEHAVPKGTTMPWHEGISGTVFKTGDARLIADVTTSTLHFAGIDRQTGLRTRDMASLPLKSWQGQPIGVLNILNKRNGRLNDDDLALLAIVAAFTALAIEQARLFQEAKLAEVVRLLGDISHDLKNLLQPVTSGSWILKSELDEVLDRARKLDEPMIAKTRKAGDTAIAMVERASRRIQDRVKQIADCVKGLSSPPYFSTCSIAQVVDEVIKTLQLIAQEKGVTIQSSGLELLPPILADEGLLFNAFYNLVNNAIPEVHAGGCVTIAGTLQPDRQAVLLSVADTGRGMPPDVRDSLFTSGAISRKKGGTGLGTKIVKDAIDLHGGAIWVESKEGRGTTFHILLPLQQAGRTPCMTP